MLELLSSEEDSSDIEGSVSLREFGMIVGNPREKCTRGGCI